MAFITVVESTGMGTETSGAAANVLVALDEDLKHDAVDAVSSAVIGDGAHGVGALAEAVDPALALFVARGVPREVVVHDRGESVLQVDAFREAVGGDQHAGAVVFGQSVDADLAFLRGAGFR